MAKSTLRSILKQIVTILVAIVFTFAFLFIAFIISQFLQSNEFSFLSIAITVGFLGISLFISSLTHNLGHFLVGNIFHYQKISHNSSGFTMIPTQKETSMIRQILYYASGILCNLILGIAIFCVACFAPLGLPTIPWLFLFTFGVTLFVSACVQAISYYSEGVPTDGKVVWGLLFHSDFAKYYVATTNLFGALKTGLRPSQIPMRSYSREAELQSSDMLLVLYLYYKALDLQKASAMIKYVNILEENLSIVPKSLHSTVVCELCYANTVMGLDEQAATYFSLMKKLPADTRSMSYYRALAYYFLYCKDNYKQALSAISYAIETSDSCEFKGMLALEQQLLQALLQNMAEEL